jgi:hypothetical protein
MGGINRLRTSPEYDDETDMFYGRGGGVFPNVYDEWSRGSART